MDHQSEFDFDPAELESRGRQLRTCWNPDPPIFLDIETQSAANIREVGSLSYLAHPTTRLMSLVARCHGRTLIWIPPGRLPTSIHNLTIPGAEIYLSDDPPAPLLAWISEGGTCVAHNAFGFDAEAFRRFVSPVDVGWYDTIPCCRAAGLPGSLDEVGEALGIGGKDDRGGKAMKLLSVAKWHEATQTAVYPVGTPALWEQMLAYNVRDVDLLERIYHETADFGEPDVIDADLRINRRGVSVDLLLCNALSAAWSHAQYEAGQEIERITQGGVRARDVRSVETIKAWMRDFGVKLDSLDKRQVSQFLDDPTSFCDGVDADRLAEIEQVLQLRAICCSAAGGKLATLRDRARDGRIYESLVYYGAGPGRWAGRGVQPQNLGRGGKDVPIHECIAAVVDATESAPDLFAGLPGRDVAEILTATAPGIPLRETLDTLTRPVFRAPLGSTLAICDFSGVEARGLSWAAGDEDAIDVFRRGDDPYKVQAAKVFGVPISDVTKEQRQVGKALVLGCGYGMGWRKFAVTCRNQGIDLDAAGVSAEACVTAFRESRPLVKRLWRDLENAALDVVSGEKLSVDVGRCRWAMRGPHLLCVLPSGRPIVYRNARVEMEVPVYCKMFGLPEVEKECVKYDHPKGYRKNVYGGLLAENVVQGLCRDLLAVALVRCEREGLPVVLHVHDEIVLEVDEADGEESLRRLKEIMTEPPVWAAGFPIAAEGFVSDRYSKG